MDDLISRQAAIELFKDDIVVVNELNNLPPLPDRMKYVQESVNIIMNTCKSDSIKDKAFRNAARMIQNAIDGEAPDFETIEELPSAQTERKKGKWIERNPRNSPDCRLIECSECGNAYIVGYNINYDDWIDRRNFCMKCGADLRGGSNGKST